MAELDSGGYPAAVPGTQGQLTLPVGLRDEATFSNFFAHGATQAVVDSLRRQVAGEREQEVMYLHGPAGSGKTHLLQSVAHLDSAGCLYLPLAELGAFDPEAVLQRAELSRRVCVDDLQAVAGDLRWEKALFDLYNRALESGCHLLVAADSAPRVLPLVLEDLRSRLSWGVVFHLHEPDDQAKADILALRGAARSMTLSPAVASFIVSRAPRETGQLLAVLDHLAEVSLVRKRPLSIPFVKEVLDW